MSVLDTNSGKQVLVDREALGEKNDCTVRAIMEVMQVPYLTAYGIMIGAGRKRRKGIVVDSIYDALCKEKLERPGMSVESYVKLIAHSGRWIIGIRGHVFAIVDGVIKDLYPESVLNCHVNKVWRF